MCILLLNFHHLKLCIDLTLLTPMDLIPLPVYERVSLDGNRKAQVVKTLYESVQVHIKKRNRVHATKANKGCKHVVFQPDNWVWVHGRRDISGP